MNIGVKTALGIDITAKSVSLALLKKTSSGIRLVNSVSVPLSPGVIIDGRIVDHLSLSRAVRTACSSHRIKSRVSSISLCAEPSLLQILDLPRETPVNVRKYVQDEIKQYAVLPLKNIEMDYCASGSSQSTSSKQILMCAARLDEMVLCVRKLEKGCFDVRRIEPALLAYLRACYAGISSCAKDKNLLLVMVRESILTLCIFRNSNIEFLRTRKLDDLALPDSSSLSHQLEREIRSVVQYYDLQVQDVKHNWEITLFGSDGEIDASLVSRLSAELSGEQLELRIFSQQDLSHVITVGDSDDSISPVAVGLALKILEPASAGYSLNLLPKSLVDYRNANKELLLIANIAAVLLVVIFLRLGSLTSKSLQISKDVDVLKQSNVEDGMRELLKSQLTIGDQLKRVKSNLLALSDTGKPERFVKWARVLAELGSNVPRNVQIQNISVTDAVSLEVEGIAVSYDAVSAFSQSLSGCSSIDSSLLNETNVDVDNGGLVSYSITCNVVK